MTRRELLAAAAAPAVAPAKIALPEKQFFNIEGDVAVRGPARIVQIVIDLDEREIHARFHALGWTPDCPPDLLALIRDEGLDEREFHGKWDMADGLLQENMYLHPCNYTDIRAVRSFPRPDGSIQDVYKRISCALYRKLHQRGDLATALLHMSLLVDNKRRYHELREILPFPPLNL